MYIVHICTSAHVNTMHYKPAHLHSRAHTNTRHMYARTHTHTNKPTHTRSRSDLNLDTKLELLRSREYMEYTFHTHPVHRDGRYRGQWRDAMPHGR